MTQKNRKLTATKLRLLLALVLVLIFGLSAASFIYMRGQIAAYASEVNAVEQKAQDSESRNQDLEKTKVLLDKYNEDRELAKKVVAESQTYRYQNEIINDITSYAGKAGVPIKGFTFQSGDPIPTSAPAPAEGAATPDMSAEASVDITASLSGTPKSTTVVVELGDKVNYNNFLRFMSLVEQNLTKMQIANVSLTRSDEGGPGVVGVEALSMEVYIR